MGDIADDLTDAGLEQYERHENGECEPAECQYCQEEEVWYSDKECAR